MSGILYVVSTAIGNPRDLSPRARDVLGSVDLVLAEDTRTARRLLAELGLAKPLLSCFDGNEAARADEVAQRLLAGENVALVSEAGTPALSDPGQRVVRAAVASGVRIVPVPGPSALLAALVASGLPTDAFAFLGFLPRRAGPRRRLLAGVAALPVTLVVYESPVRTAATLGELAAVLGEAREACVARELTKTHEEIVRGTLAALRDRYAHARPLGEVTLVVAGSGDDVAVGAEDEDVLGAAAQRLDAGRSARDIATELAVATGRPRREIYALVLRAARAVT